MATQGMPQQKRNGRFGSGFERLLIAVLLVLLIMMTGLLGWQVWKMYATPISPTVVPPASLPGLATTQPHMQISPGTGTEGTLITVWGQGWQPDDQLIVCLDDLGDAAEPVVYAETAVNEAGEFVVSFVFPTDVQWQSVPDIPVVVESKAHQEKRASVFKLQPESEESALLTTTPLPGVTAVAATATPACIYSMSFVSDITIPDDTVISPGVSFVKTWRIRNSGICTWPAGTSWVFAGGSQMNGPDSVPVPGTNPGETADVSVRLTTPSVPGQYTGYWTLRLPEGVALNQQYYVRIIVPAPTSTPRPTIPTPTPLPATPTFVPATPTPVILYWRGEYYNNQTVLGLPVLVRDDAGIDFSWGAGSPALAVTNDNFSVRWTRDLNFEGGSYRFYAHSDDGVRIWIDNQLILDEWHDATGTTYTADVVLSRGNHTVRVEYYEAVGTAQIQVWWDRVDNYSEWRGEYWSNPSLSGSSTLVRNDTAVDFNWGTGSPAANIPADNFSARWTRTYAFSSGNYRFHAGMDDGLRLYIDNSLLIDEWRDASYRDVSADRWLSAGSHDIRIEYYERVDQARVNVWWEMLGNSADWRGEYWSNKTLSGSPSVLRNDVKIDFDWGFSAPAPGLPEEAFSARWTRTIDFEPGTYRLSARADDGIRVYVDGQKVIDRWQLSGGERTVTVERSLGGKHTLVVEYFEDRIAAEVHFWYERIGN